MSPDSGGLPPPPGVPVDRVVGQVVREPFAVGSKSERSAALLLVAGDRRWRLRRRGAPAYGDEDPDLAALVGSVVAVTGTPLATAFLIDSWAKQD